MRGTQIKALTGIRGYLALWVFAIHASYAAPALAILHNTFVTNGYLGVDGFFILSGLVLFHVHGQEMAVLSRLRTTDFLLLRLARVYPLHLFMFCLFLLYVAVLMATGGTRNPGEYSVYAALAHLTLTQAWFGNHRFIQTWNSPAWTISAEWAAYLLFPLLAWGASQTKPILLFLTSLFLFVLFEFALDFSAGNNVFRVLPEFLLGISLAKIASPSHSTAQKLFVVAAAAIGCGLVWHNTFASVLGLATLVYCLRTEGTAVAWLLSTRYSVWLGEISYAVYMCHMFVLKFTYRALAGRIPDGLMILIGLGLTLAMATFCYRFVETPWRRWIRSIRPAKMT